MQISNSEILELYKLLKKHETDLSDEQYSLFLKFQKELYRYFSVDQLENFNKALEEGK